MIKTNNNLFQILLITFCVMFLSGCEDEYSNDACIKDISEATIKGEACKSLDLAVLRHQTKAAVIASDYTNYYEADDDFLTAEQAARQNKIDKANNLRALSAIDDKKMYKDFFFNPWFLTICVLIHLFTLMKVPENRGMFLSFIILTFISYKLIQTAVETEEIHIQSAKGSIYTSNYIARVGQVNKVKSISNAEEFAETTSDNQAYIDTSDFMKMNVCLSNTAKFGLEGREYAFNTFDSKEHIAEIYNLKNQPYIVGVDDREGRQIGYSLGNAGFLQHINVPECAEVQFPSLRVDSDLLEVMEKVGFKQFLHTAITKKDFVVQFTNMKNAFNKINTTIGSIEANEQLTKLYTIFSVEYMKGVMWGSIYTDYKLKDYTVKNRDFSNLATLFESADQVYNNIVETECLKKGSFVKDTMKAIDDFDTTNTIGQYDCVTIEDDTIRASSQALNYLTKRIVIDDRRASILEETLPISLSASNELVEQYRIVTKTFAKELKGVSNFSKDLAYLYNKGSYAQGEFYAYLNNHENKYMSLNASLVDVSKIIYTMSLPSFNFDPDPMITTDINTVNAFLKSLDDKIDYERSEISSNFTNAMIEYSYDNSSFNNDEVISNGSSSSNDSISSFLENHSETFSAANKMICSGDKTKCAEKLDGFDGSKEWHTVGNGLVEIGAKATVVSTGIYIGLSAVEGVINWQKRKGDTKQVVMGNRSKAGLASTFVGASKSAAGGIALLSLSSMILGTAMISLFNFQGIILDWFIQTQTIYLSIMSLLIIMINIIGVCTNYKMKDVTKTLSLSLQCILYVNIVGVAISLIVFLSNYMIIDLLNNMPNISSTILSDNSGSAMDMIVSGLRTIVMLIVLVFVCSVLLIRILINSVSKLTTSSFDGAFESADMLIRRTQTVAVGGGIMGLHRMGANRLAKGVAKSFGNDEQQK